MAMAGGHLPLALRSRIHKHLDYPLPLRQLSLLWDCGLFLHLRNLGVAALHGNRLWQALTALRGPVLPAFPTKTLRPLWALGIHATYAAAGPRHNDHSPPRRMRPRVDTLPTHHVHTDQPPPAPVPQQTRPTGPTLPIPTMLTAPAAATPTQRPGLHMEDHALLDRLTSFNMLPVNPALDIAPPGTFIIQVGRRPADEEQPIQRTDTAFVYNPDGTCAGMMSVARLNWLTSQWACTQAAEPVLHASLSKDSLARHLAHLLTQSAYRRGQPQRQRQFPDHY